MVDGKSSKTYPVVSKGGVMSSVFDTKLKMNAICSLELKFCVIQPVD